jgi:hypothetical protein
MQGKRKLHSKAAAQQAAAGEDDKSAYAEFYASLTVLPSIFLLL